MKHPVLVFFRVFHTKTGNSTLCFCEEFTTEAGDFDFILSFLFADSLVFFLGLNFSHCFTLYHLIDIAVCFRNQPSPMHTFILTGKPKIKSLTLSVHAVQLLITLLFCVCRSKANIFSIFSFNTLTATHFFPYMELPYLRCQQCNSQKTIPKV